MTWSQSYVSDVNYTFGYHPELNPAVLRLACLCHGITPSFQSAPTYLELGFGQGVSLAIHAAGSDGAYWGADFNPAHVAGALDLAFSSGGNLRLLEDSFEELAARRDLPEFDVIALHGVWSWVSDASRRIMKDIIRRQLRPGGIVYLSYNCLPGWAPLIPIRQLMASYRDRSPTGTVMNGTIPSAMVFVEAVAQAGSGYFQDSPAAMHHLETLRRHGPSYLGRGLT